MNECFEDRQEFDSGECCVYVVTDCSDPEAPGVSSDCGINDPVVRAWAGPYRGSQAPWATRNREFVIDCSACSEVDGDC